MTKENVGEVLKKATEDAGYCSLLVQDCAKALSGYNLTSEERLAIRTGDIRWIESHTGAKINPQLAQSVFMPLLSKEQW